MNNSIFIKVDTETSSECYIKIDTHDIFSITMLGTTPERCHIILKGGVKYYISNAAQIKKIRELIERLS